jgi:ATP-binding cassette subfamily B protein
MTTATHGGYRRLLPFLRPHRRSFALGALGIAGYVLFTLTLPVLAGRLAGSIGSGDLPATARWLGLALLAFLIRSAFQYAENVLMMRASLAVTFDLRVALYRHIHRLGLAYFERQGSGDLSYRLTEDVDRIGEVLFKISQQFVSSALQLVAIPIYMLTLNWQLTLSGLVLAPLMAWLISSFGQRLLALSRQSQSRISDLSSLLTEVLGSMRLVQASAAQEFEIGRFRRQAEANRHARYRAEHLKALQYPVVGFLEALSILSLFLVGGWQIAAGNLRPEAFVSFLAAVALLLHPIDLVSQHFNELKATEASAERLAAILAEAPALPDGRPGRALPALDGRVAFEAVAFAYTPGRPVLDGISLVVPQGQVVALVGGSGAGKTTLINLLLRLYDPLAGRILIDGIDLRELEITGLRHQIGLVPQDITLFSGDIAGNIAYGEDEPDLERVETVARLANAHSFISGFAQGYHSWVGERGVNLSGGQKQRIAIARALYFDPRILILDEATSALDAESENLVQEALDRAMRGRTVFVIAHRMSTVRAADRILFLEHGHILEDGDHDALMAANGRYASFFHRQFEALVG